VRDIVGQSKTTIDFSALITQRRIIFVKIPAWLPADVKRFVGTIITSELMHAVRKRERLPEAARHQYCIYVDEFQHFVNNQDLGSAINEARKFGVATTLAHQERYGQLLENRSILGATDAAVNRVFFQLSGKDAVDYAGDFARSPPIEIRLERAVVISQNPFQDLLRGDTEILIFKSL
jgi:hypothetical protein